MIDFFKCMKEKLVSEGVDEAAFLGMFSGIKGIVLLDTCGNTEKLGEDLKKLGLGLKILKPEK
jgi:hypothetical protein